MIGIELERPELLGQAIIEAPRRGLLVSFCLSQPRVLRVYPPAVVSNASLEDGLDRVLSALEAAAAHMAEQAGCLRSTPTSSRDVPVERIWEAMVDFERYPETMQNVLEVRCPDLSCARRAPGVSCSTAAS